MIHPPLEVMLSWPRPNYVNPVTREEPIIIAASIVIPLMTLVVSLRLYSRLKITKSFGADDWMILMALITGILHCVCALLGTRYGWYKHIWDVPFLKLVNARKLIVAMALMGMLNVASTKISVLLLYRRLFPPSTIHTVATILLFITTGWMLASTATNFMLCIPLSSYWDVFYTGKQTCMSEVAYFVGFSAIDLFLDIAIYVLPLYSLSRLRMPRRQKAILVGIFAFGILAITAAALRLPSLVRTSKSYDMTWEIYSAELWTMVESCVGVICASAPALKPLVQKYVPAVLGNLTSSKSNGKSREESKEESQGDMEMLDSEKLTSEKGYDP